MKKSSKPKAVPDEIKRLKTLFSLKILDTPCEKRLDEIVKTASLACNAPTALVSLVDEERQWFKAKVGLEACETSRDVAFCHYAIQQDKAFVVEDATKHELFSKNPLVIGELGIRFYVGVPLEVEGFKIGTLCLIDYKPRKATDSMIAILNILAGQVVDHLVQRKEQMEEREIKEDYKHLSTVLEDVNNLHYKEFDSEDELLKEYLKVGARNLDMEFGIVSEIKNQEYSVDSCISPNQEIPKGATFNIQDTYCSRVLSSGDTVTHFCVGKDPEMRTHPVYLGLGLESYIGTPIRVDNEIVGTLNFSSTKVRPQKFRPLEIHLLQILAKTIGSRLERKKEQAAIQQQNELIRQQQIDNEILRESSELGLWKWDLLTNKIAYDSRLCEMLGYKLEEVEQSLDTWEKLTHPADKGRCFQQMKAYIEGKEESFEIIFRVKHAEGHWVPILSKGKIIKRDESDVPLIFCGTHFDMSKVMEAKAETDKLRYLANRIQEIAQIGGWEMELKSQNLVWSPEVYRIHGIKEGTEIKVEDAINFYAEHERERITKCVQLAIEEQKIYNEEFEFYDVQGNRKWVKAFGEPVIDESGDTVALRGYFQDITEAICRRKEIEKLRDLAEEASRAKSQFLANMSHELRTPLNAVIGYSDLLLEDADPGQVDLVADLEKIRDGGVHLLNLINQILDLSKVEAGKKEAYIEPIALPPLLKEIENLTCLAVEKNKNKLSFNFSNMPPMIRTDHEMLKQIMINLIANAAKFTKQGKIDVTGFVEARANGENYVFEVRDTGVGIPADKLELIFSEFNQADDSTTRNYGGTGLGLTISRRFVSLLKGKIEVESEEGHGSCFRIILPAGSSESKVHDLPIKSFNGSSILIIDDEQEAREITLRSLSSIDAKVYEASGGREGLEMAKSLLPSLIVLDISMPDMDGWEVLEKLKSNDKTKSIPVMVVSMVNHEKAGLELGASVYFVKPVNKRVIVEAVGNLLEKKAS